MNIQMHSISQAIALGEVAISCGVVIIWLLQKISQKAFPSLAKVFLLLVLVNLFFWPLGLSLELPLAAYVRGVIGDLSVVTMLLLWSTLLPKPSKTPMAFSFSISLIALGFYPFALGVGMVDPYAWGYGSTTFLVAVLVFAVICGLANWVKGVWLIGLAIIAWSVHWHESTNLWDYLLDPVLAIWAIVSLLEAFLQKRKQKARSGYLFRPG
ncbi:hypothetical protein [Polynucleobacter necessarius]|uniref:hypothetical protein n=1 Tax=Polynucleobacter necessarius TaxID=576610 RepID=UPI001E4B460E|nr:hypothetical protein [Polynucleobacter necessarius]